jgi:hypothetical protein
MTIWDDLSLCVSLLDEPFQRSEIVSWFRRHRPDINDSSLAVHIQMATSNAADRGPFAGRQPLLTRIERGTYVRYRPSAGEDRNGPGGHPREPAGTPALVSGEASARHEESGPQSAPSDAMATTSNHIVLIGCVKTKQLRAMPAAELFTGALFDRRRRYAEDADVPWYLLSGKYGLLEPDEVIGPYDEYLADQSRAYRDAWGRWVVTRLRLLVPQLTGTRVEIHAGRDYVEPIRSRLEALGAVVETPLNHLRQGEQLRWYDQHVVQSQTRAVPRPPRPSMTSVAEAPPRSGSDTLAPVNVETEVAEVLRLLTDESLARPVGDVLVQADAELGEPGLYS